ncbi:hypothetical protein CHRYSEOSP005_24420 [Chryseobacterium sp. Alg-005]|uniref:hypothetical protein n=1 Tax=Chryseobacterium sp. Alg-005 TaxID=3159516 RepID=UPI003555B0C2
MMKRISLLLAFLISSIVFAQKIATKVFDRPTYSILVPEIWKVMDNNEIVNIFPDNQIGAITISEYHDLALPESETKKFILALYRSTDEESKIKSRSGKKGYTEYSYEYFDEKEKLYWTTKVFQKEKDLYLITINCKEKYWNGNYMSLFNETFNSFKIKK